MKQTITKSDKNLKILNKLIVNGFYNGYVEPERFELLRSHFMNNHRLIGILNKNGKYVVTFDYKTPMNILIKVFLVLAIISSIVFVINRNWVMPILFLILVLIMVIDFKLKKRKEIDLFTSKFLEFDKEEYD